MEDAVSELSHKDRLAEVANVLGLLREEENITRGQRELLFASHACLHEIVCELGREPLTGPIEVKNKVIHQWPDDRREQWKALK